ncbi:anti-sigma factor antagonist [Micromonospora humi]|uniref:Anti-sigma factor antagonist n=1 Tax=Micromonospora humi TaxID=745366 RepID=A0A1C5JD45_9ACTN|nr:anti-sigma factor antagonist [Micromonospora humi]SCG68453.1 anti-anti-sigma factor [Micromonospora humi]
MQERLQDLRRRVGAPSYSTIVNHAERHGYRLSTSSITNLLKAASKPRLETVEAFVVGCMAYAIARKARRQVPPELVDLKAWQKLYADTYPEHDGPRETFPQDLRQSYLSRLSKRYHHVELQTLLASGITGSATPALAGILVQPRVRRDVPTVELPREARLRPVRELMSLALPDGIDADLVVQTRQAHEAHPVRPALEVLTDPSLQHLVLLGDPGSGKSVMIRHLASLLSHQGAASRAAPLDGALPLLVELRVFAAPRWRDGTFIELLDHLYRSEGLGFPAETLEALFRDDGRAVVVFDGLDEIFDAELRQRVSHQIAGFAFHYPRVRIVVTSRPTGYRRGPLEGVGFTHFMLQDFDRHEVEQFVDRWYTAHRPGGDVSAKMLSTRFMWAYDNSTPVRELSGNPLLLTILAVVNERHSIPLHRRDAYEHALGILVDQWDVNKHLRHDAVLQLDRAGKMDMLRWVARATLRGGGLAGNYIQGETLLGELEIYLRTRYELPAYQARPAAQAIVAEFRERTFVISRFGADVYGFVHRCFLEYFAAADLAHRLTVDRDQLVPDLFGRNWSSPEWHEVLVLVTGMIPDKDAAQAIDQLLAADPLWYWRDDADPQHLLLALRCLGEVRQPRRLPDQGIRMSQALLAMLETAHRRETLEHDDALARALLAVGPPILEALGSAWAGHPLFDWWYRTRGRFLPVSPAVSAPVFAAATRLCAALSTGVDEVRQILAVEAEINLDPLARVAAVAALAAGWPEHPATARIIRRCATVDTDKDVRREALRTLVSRWPHDYKTDKSLWQARTDPNRAVRRAAIGGATAMWSNSSYRLEFLRSMVTDADPAVREAALSTLVRYDTAEPSTAVLTRDLAADDPEPMVRRTAVRALAERWHTLPDTMRLVRRRITDDPDPQVRSAALNAVATYWPEYPSARSMVQRHAARDPHWSVRRSALQALASGWPEDERSLAAIRACATRDPVALVRAVALRTLATRWPTHASVRELLFRRVREDDDWTVRSAAWEAVATVCPGDTRAWAGLRETLAGDPVPALRAMAVALAAKVRPEHPQARDAVIDAARDPDPQVRGAAVQALGTAWVDDPAVRDALLDRAVHDDDHRVRCAAVAVDLLPADVLRERLHLDRHPSVRRTALVCLVSRYRSRPLLVPILSTMVATDSDPELRALAARSLGDAPPDVAREALDAAANDPESAVRAAAAGALATFGSPARITVHRLATQDPDASVRRTALQTLFGTWPGDDATSAAVRAATADTAPSCRVVALQLLVTQEKTHPDTLALMIAGAVEDRSPEVRRTAVYLLAAELWEAATVPDLIRRRAVLDPNTEVRVAALAVSVARSPLEPATLAVVHERLSNDPDDEIRVLAARTMATRYPDHPRTHDLLHRCVTTDNSPAVREMAQALIRGTEPSGRFSTSVEPFGMGIAVLSAVGELDMATVPQWWEQFEEAIEAGLTRLVINLEQVTFMDSAALSVLTQVKNRLDEIGGEISVACPPRGVLRLLEVSGLVEVMNALPTVADALQRYHLPLS